MSAVTADPLVTAAQAAFPGSTIVSSLTYTDWRKALLGRLKALRKPTDLVTHLGCAGRGCARCQGGRVPLGHSKDPPEEHCLELGLRLACLARYHCPPERLPWMDQAINDITARWDTIARQNRPNF